MISYNWGSQAMAVSIAHCLKHEHGIDTWIDVDAENGMQGDIMSAMSRAVSQSDVILMLLSKGYFLSNNCHREAAYACSLNKKIVPIVVEPGFTPTDWLAMAIAGLLYYEVYAPQDVAGAISRIVSLELAKTTSTMAPPPPTPQGGDSAMSALLTRIDGLETQNRELKTTLEMMEKRLAALERKRE